uniref:Protein kinase domain-containing protein n=1 Tax=Aureoumbra lagunensis TaxID=44058 RepID=A0A7S3NPL6_9STRA
MSVCGLQILFGGGCSQMIRRDTKKKKRMQEICQVERKCSKLYQVASPQGLFRDVTNKEDGLCIEKKPIDPFCSKYRSLLSNSSDASENLTEIRTSTKAAPLLLCTKRGTATSAEKKKLVARADCEEEFTGPFLYLGHGKYGSVFRAKINSKPIALKFEKPIHCLPWEVRALALFRQRDQQRPEIIVQPKCLWLWNDAAIMSMPIYDCNLNEALWLQSKPITQKVALFLAYAILHPVARLHAADLIHCDIKPDNFLIKISSSKMPQIVLADFGRCVDLRRHIHSTPQTHKRHDSLFASTRAHIDDYLWPPAKNGKSAWTYQIDRYALGVLLHIIAIGRRPPSNTIPAKVPRGWQTMFWITAFDRLLINVIPKDPTISSAHDLQELADMALLTYRNLTLIDDHSSTASSLQDDNDHDIFSTTTSVPFFENDLDISQHFQHLKRTLVSSFGSKR